MVNTTKIAQSLTGLIGLYPSLYGDQFEPGSQHRQPVAYLSDAHKLLRPEILSSLITNLTTVHPEPYDGNRSYMLYELVADEGNEDVYYESLVVNNSGNDLNDTKKWQKTTLLSAWFSRIERGAIAKLGLMYTGPNKPLLANQALYSKEGNARDSLNRQGRFVFLGLQFPSQNVALGVIRAGLQVTGPIANFPLYIFHSEQDAPVAIIYLTGNTSGRTVWNNVNRTLYQSSGGYYMIGYYEDDLPAGVFAVGAIRAFTVQGCSACMGSDYGLVSDPVQHVTIQPGMISGPLEPGVMSWTQDDEMQIGAQSWGINLVIEAKCDSTADIVNNSDMFHNALLYTIACDVLEEISTNDRVNAVADKMTSQAYVALNGQKDSKEGGLRTDQKKAMKDLREALASLSPTCMSPEIRKGIRFGSVFD